MKKVTVNLLIIVAIIIVIIACFTHPANAQSRGPKKVTLLFPASPLPIDCSAQAKTVDSLKRLGFKGDPASVHVVYTFKQKGYNMVSITFVKPRR